MQHYACKKFQHSSAIFIYMKSNVTATNETGYTWESSSGKDIPYCVYRLTYSLCQGEWIKMKVKIRWYLFIMKRPTWQICCSPESFFSLYVYQCCTPESSYLVLLNSVAQVVPCWDPTWEHLMTMHVFVSQTSANEPFPWPISSLECFHDASSFSHFGQQHVNNATEPNEICIFCWLCAGNYQLLSCFVGPEKQKHFKH